MQQNREVSDFLSSPRAPARDKSGKSCNDTGSVCNVTGITNFQRSRASQDHKAVQGSKLGSGGVTDCPAVANTNRTRTEFHSVFQDLRCVITLSESKTTTRGGSVPSFTHNTKKILHLYWIFRSKLCSHNLPNECAQWLCRVQVTTSTQVAMIAHFELLHETDLA